MKNRSSAKSFGFIRPTVALMAAIVFGVLGTTSPLAAPLTINVIGVDANGVQTPVTASYRWTVEEDATKASIPGQPATSANLSLSMHRSYMPVVAAGRVPLEVPPTADPDVIRVYSQTPASLNLASSKRYYVSVAAVGYQMGGAPVVFSGGGATATATVYLNQYPLPTAQIAVEVFEDSSPLNGAPNPPVEAGLPGFTVKLIEAGGTYGMSGGEVTQDGFGNPLGTTYTANGDVLVRGKGIILTGPDGTATIKNLFPGKYTILVVPPNGSDWHQTSTIEGTRGIDAWVKNNEPPFFQEFGPPGAHVFVGFTRSGCIQGNNQNAARCPGLNVGTAHTITGRVIDNHNSRPPVYTFYDGAPVGECWVGLNAAPAGAALKTRRCNKDGTFEITGVGTGTYELVIWDDPLDVIIATTTIIVDPNDPDVMPQGNLRVNSWFGRYQGRVFQDIDGTGLPFFNAPFNRPFIYVDPVTGLESESTQTFAAGDLKPAFGEGIANNIRFRDGSIYQSVNTKTDGTFAFTEVFPFFNYMVAEIDYARYKASGATIVVDGGGEINAATNATNLWGAAPGLFGGTDPALAYNPWIRLNPQQQADLSYYRTENCGATGPNGETGQCAILLEAMQTFLGQTNHIEWGKQPYKITENGGIAGIVHYAITRAENDPRFAAAEEWEPGIARVQVNMFLDCDADTYPDKPMNDGSGLCAPGGLSHADNYQYVKPDVDNYPFCWRNPDDFVANNASLCPNGQRKGLEDVARSGDVNDPLKPFNFGDVFRWGAPASDALPNPGPDDQPEVGLSKTDAWDDSIPTGCQNPGSTAYVVPSTGETLDCFDGLRNFNQVVPAVFDGGYAFGRVAGQAELPMVIGKEGKGTYIVEAVAPPGYLHQGNGDLNVVFGDQLKASTAALPLPCVGMELDVPANLTLFPGEPNPNYEAGERRWRKCDMKAVPLLPGTNPPPDFWMYTEAPVAGHGVGFILDDTASEFNHLAPNFGEKYAPPHMPVSIQDWTGREISRVYSDQYGSYNFLVPSSFTINPPFPSGVMPSMMVACMNHPGPIKIGVNPDGSDKLGIDPFFNRRYTQFCYTLQYLAGKTTYLDTPVLPIAAFASVEKNPLDCECDNSTPAIYSATNGTNGPRVPTGLAAAVPAALRQLTIVSMGTVQVANPAFDPGLVAGQPDPQNPAVTIPPTDPRLQKTIARDYGFGNVRGAVTLNGNAMSAADVPTWSNDIIVATLPAGLLPASYQLMITRGDNNKQSVVGLTVHRTAAPPTKVSPTGSDVAGCGTAGGCKTIQYAIDQAPAGSLITIAPGSYNEFVIMDKLVRLQGWGAGSVTINAAKSSSGALATWRARINRDAGTTFALLPGQATPDPFAAEEAPGILVVGNPARCVAGLLLPVLTIDGLTVTGGDSGGGILASGYACGFEVSNNRVVANYGTYGGGIRVGHTTLVNGTAYTDGFNRRPNIHHNWISQNGATEAGGGGGITLGTGSDSYVVTSNYICGNFSMADGGGFSHLGLSAGAITNTGAAGTANQISQNKFIFNQTFNQLADPTGAGLFIGGQVPLGGGAAAGTGDVVVDANLFQGNQAGAGAGGGVSIARTLSGNNVNQRDDIVLTNNMIVNNVAAYTGGGVALTNTGNGVSLVNNTVASNASTATNRQSFDPAVGPEASVPQIAGVSVFGGASPTLLNNILWANRSYMYVFAGAAIPALIDPPADQMYYDLGRVGVGAALEPRYSVLTTGGVGNVQNITGCTNTAPTSLPVVCNRLAAPDSTTLFVKANSFLSIVDPTQPIVLVDATVLLQSALTFDEGGNFINVIFSPLTLWDSTGALRANYHLASAAIARDIGRARATNNSNFNQTIGATLVPTVDIDGDSRPTAVDIGSDEGAAAALPPTLTSISPSSGALGATIAVTLGGTNLANASAMTVSGTGVTCAVTSSTATSVTASCTIASTATTGARTVNVTTPGGTSGNVNFTVTAPAPVLTSISPASGARPPLFPIGGTTVVPVTIIGTNLTGASVNVSNVTLNNIAVSGVSVNATGTQINATFTIARIPNPTGAHSVTVTTSAGTSGAVTFTVN